MEKRKLQLVGGSSYMVSLPKDWVRKNNLKQGDELILIECDNSLKIIPKVNDGLSVHIRLPKMDFEFLKRIFYSLYIQGIDEIVVERPDESLFKNIGEIIEDIVGMEVFDADTDKIILKCITTSFDVTDALKRLCQIIFAMFDVIENNLENGGKINEIINLEKDADKFYILALRMIYKRLINSYNLSDLVMMVESRAIAKMLEEIADSLYDISTGMGICSEFVPVFQSLKRLFKIAIDVYFSRDSLMSKNLIEMANKLEENILTLKDKSYCEIGSLLEICRYIKSIGEMSFNSAVCKEFVR